MSGQLTNELQYRNMFLAAAPYFHYRLQSDPWAASHYQPSITSVSTIANLGMVITLAKIQENASYPRRIVLSFTIHIFVFTLLALSTVIGKGVSAGAYFNFLMIMAFGASMGTGINQNGVFAYVLMFGRKEYTQAIMAGQGVAGVLPSVVQMLLVLAVPGKKNGLDSSQDPSKSAFVYFITATAISSCALICFLYLLKRESGRESLLPNEDDESILSEHVDRKIVSLQDLFKKLRWTALSVFMCFAITMVYPVFTATIESVHSGAGRSRLFEPSAFVPLGLLAWNTGDLIGRVLVLIPQISLMHRPRALFIFAIARSGFIILYLLCNIHGRGAVVQSDVFYIFIVQLLFGVSNGYLGSSCMIGASQWVSPEEKEPAGGFMVVMLVGGLTAGSLMSFFVPN